jgi:hypothetical protein
MIMGCSITKCLYLFYVLHLASCIYPCSFSSSNDLITVYYSLYSLMKQRREGVLKTHIMQSYLSLHTFHHELLALMSYITLYFSQIQFNIILFYLGFPTIISCAYLISPMYITCSAHIILLDLITLILFYKCIHT